MPTCIACGGPMEILGVLGSTEHLRCRNCGTDLSRPAEDDDLEPGYMDDASYLEQGWRAEEEPKERKSLWDRLKEDES